MVFMHKKTGELYELLILSIEETDLVYNKNSCRAFRIGTLTLFGTSHGEVACMNIDFHKVFKFMGVI